MKDKTYNPDEQQQNKTTRAASEPQAYYAAAASSYNTPAPAEPQALALNITFSKTSREAIMLEAAPIYPEKCRRWKERPELLHRRSLVILLYQCRTVEVLAAYLNCSKQQVYAAMDYHRLPRARCIIPLAMKKAMRQ